MWIVAGILFVTIVIAMLEVPSLLRNGLKKELWTFSILLLTGAGLSIAEGLDKDIPNPMDGIAIIYKPLSDLVLNWLK